ncbi:MAG: hypothetical protein Q9221_005930 [Calogaya cf. arnoldii]
MAKLSSVQKVQKRLVENVTLLWALCEVPDLPKENKLNGSDDRRRRLSLHRERQLVDSFAFLSAATDNMYRVMAVCIEEDPGGDGMTIRLASNTGDLAFVTQGFNDIARTLEHASLRTKSRTGIRQDLFRQVVILDESRILSRLRSRHAARTRKTIGKPELLPLLDKTIHHKSIHSGGKLTKTNLDRIQSSTKHLAEKFYKFEAARQCDSSNDTSREILHDLLVGIGQFDVNSLQTALESSHVVDPSLKTSLPHALSKIGRYYQIACDLIDAARSELSTLFRSISVHAVEQPQLDMRFVAGHSTGFGETIKRVTRPSQQYRQNAFDPGHVSAVRTKYQNRITDCATAWKCHAEIQILLFYEQMPHTLNPRIIGSSKSACYLCNLFIQNHRQFQVPRSHGRLYDRWIIPLDQVSVNGPLRPVVDRFNGALEAKIVSVLTDKQLPFAHPAESVLVFRQAFSPNPTLSSISNRDTKIIQETTVTESKGPSRETIEPRPATSSGSIPIPETSINPDDVAANLSVDEIRVQRPFTQPATTSSCSVPISKTSINRDDDVTSLYADKIQIQKPTTQPITTTHRLYQGDSMSCKLTRESDAFVVEADAGTIHMYWDGPYEEDVEPKYFTSRCACWVQVTSLSSNAQKVRSLGLLEGINVDSLIPGHDHVVEDGSGLSSKQLVLQFQGHTLLIKYSFEDPENHQISKNGEGRTP